MREIEVDFHVENCTDLAGIAKCDRLKTSTFATNNRV